MVGSIFWREQGSALVGGGENVRLGESYPKHFLQTLQTCSILPGRRGDNGTRV